MPDTRNRRDDEFAKYDAMSTEELQQLLREDASKPVGEESDADVLFYVMEVLTKRRKERNEGKSPEEALESFKKHYNTENKISSDSERVLVAPKRSGIGRWMKGLIAAAAILVFVIGGSITAQAMGFDLWEIIAKWTQETFHFGYAIQEIDDGEPSKERSVQYSELSSILQDFEITLDIIPTWLPDGYEAVDVEVYEMPIQRHFVAIFMNGENMIKIQIKDYLGNSPEQIEQSDELLEIYTINDVDYYIFANYDLLKAVWLIENYECYISGPLSVSDIKKMINSIGEG